MKGQEGTTVKIQVLRGEETLDFSGKKEWVATYRIYYYDNNIGYIKYQFLWPRM